jgi:hypothetical protein
MSLDYISMALLYGNWLRRKADDVGAHIKYRHNIEELKFCKEVFYHLLAFESNIAPELFSYYYDKETKTGEIATRLSSLPTLYEMHLPKKKQWLEIERMRTKMALESYLFNINIDLHAKNILVHPDTHEALQVCDWGSLGAEKF